MIKSIVISILIIYIAHTGWNYILDVCTTKKKKNLVQFQNEKYTSILERLQTESSRTQTESRTQNENHGNGYTSEMNICDDFSSFSGFTADEMEKMKEELLASARI